MTRINIRDYLHFREEETGCKEHYPLTQDQRDEMLEAFTLYDKDGDGLINTKEIAKVMRSVGQVPTVCEETDIVAQYAHDECYDIDFITFIKLMIARYKTFDEEEELREAFRRFDKDENGFVDKADMKKMLTSIGEPLTEEEVDEWLENGKPFQRGGKLYYEDFATFMLSK